MYYYHSTICVGYICIVSSSYDILYCAQTAQKVHVMSDVSILPTVFVWFYFYYTVYYEHIYTYHCVLY